MKANKKLLFFAVIVGVLTVVALNSYIRSLDTPALAAIPHSSVVVARSTIPAHTRVTTEMLEVVSLPSDAVHPDAISTIAEASGAISRAEIIRGEQVIANRLATEDRRASLSYRVPEGMRAISIPVGEVSGVSGYISPGDKVDILISFVDPDINEMLTTYTVFQKVLVLATGPETHEKDDEQTELVSSVTLAVTPEQAEVLAYSNISGTFHLTLRSPLDDAAIELENFNAGNFDTFRER